MPRVVRFASEASLIEYIYYQEEKESIAWDSDISDILSAIAFVQHKELGVDGNEDCLSDVSTGSCARSCTPLGDAVPACQREDEEQSKEVRSHKEPQHSPSMAAQLMPWMYNLWEDAHQQEVPSLLDCIFQGEEDQEDSIALDSDVSDILPVTAFVQHKELGVDGNEDCLSDVSTASPARSCTPLGDAVPACQREDEEQSMEARNRKEPQCSPPIVAQLMPCTYDIWEDAHQQEASALNRPGAFEGTAASTGSAAAASAYGALPPWALGAQKMHLMLLKVLLRLEAAGLPGDPEKLLQLQGLESTQPAAPAGGSLATMSCSGSCTGWGLMSFPRAAAGGAAG